MNKRIRLIIIIPCCIIVGLMNTVLLRPEDVGSWKNYAGYLFLILAVVNSFFFIRNMIRAKKKNEDDL